MRSSSLSTAADSPPALATDRSTTVYNWRGSASYTLAQHNMKFGYQGSHLGDNQTPRVSAIHIEFDDMTVAGDFVSHLFNPLPAGQRPKLARDFAWK